MSPEATPNAQEDSASQEDPYEASQVESLPVPQGGIHGEYPPRARRLGLSGQVLLEFVVDAQGRPTKIEVLSATPPGYFEEAARMAVKKCRFLPATRQGKPVPCRLQLPLVFRLAP